MNYAIKATNLQLTDEIRSYVEKRLSHLDKMAKDSARCDVELEHSQLSEGPQYRAELMYHEPGEELRRSEASGATLHEAIDLAAGDLVRDVTQGKKKRQQVFRRTAVKVKEYLRGWRDSI